MKEPVSMAVESGGRTSSRAPELAASEFAGTGNDDTQLFWSNARRRPWSEPMGREQPHQRDDSRGGSDPGLGKVGSRLGSSANNQTGQGLPGPPRHGLLTGPLVQTFSELMDRLEVDDIAEFEELRKSQLGLQLAKLGIERVKENREQVENTFLGEERLAENGHVEGEGPGYFEFLRTYLRFIKKHYLPVSMHYDAMRMWAPEGSAFCCWLDQSINELEHLAAPGLVQKIVERFPLHGLCHLAQRWREGLDTLPKVREELEAQGRPMERQTVGGVATFIQIEAKKLEYGDEVIHRRLVKMGPLVVQQMYTGLDNRSQMLMREGSARHQIENALLSRVRFSEAEPQCGDGVDSLPVGIHSCEPRVEHRGRRGRASIQLRDEHPLNIGEGEHPASSAAADLQWWEEEQKKQCKHCSQLGVAGRIKGKLGVIHSEQECPFIQNFGTWSMGTWRQAVYKAPDSSAREEAVAEYNHRLRTDPEFARRVAKYRKGNKRSGSSTGH